MTEPTTKHPDVSMLNMKWFMFFVYGTISVLMTFLPIYFQHLGFGKSAIGMLMAAGPLLYRLLQTHSGAIGAIELKYSSNIAHYAYG